MNNKKKNTRQSAYSASKEWETLQPKRDEVKAEINCNSVKKVDWSLLLNSKTIIKREKAEFNKQNKQGKNFASERVSLLAPIILLVNAGKTIFSKVSSFKY